MGKSDDNERSGFDRRDFLSIGGIGAAGLLCNLTSKDLPNLSRRDVAAIDAAAASLKKPAGARASAARLKNGARGVAASTDPIDQYEFGTPDPQPGGEVVEYWVQATTVAWDAVPTKFDSWMSMAQPSVKFNALCYQEMEGGFSGPKRLATGGYARPTMPGPTLEANVGDTLVVHFRNNDIKGLQPVTMHPHGVRYTPDYDGSYLGNLTRAGGFIGPGEEFTYTWECTPSSVGVWPYHDHGPNHVLNSSRGLFGTIVVRDPAKPKPDREYFLHLHSLPSSITRSPVMLHCINGRSYAGNTPTMRAVEGEKVAMHVLDMNSDWHTFHVHGHRWQNDAGKWVDSPSVGPSEVISAEFTEDNPGRWLYHCHVASHMSAGMTGWYKVYRR
jgi:FtsP/CotA-like multicopper oxidase with cupredoxin domain